MRKASRFRISQVKSEDIRTGVILQGLLPGIMEHRREAIGGTERLHSAPNLIRLQKVI